MTTLKNRELQQVNNVALEHEQNKNEEIMIRNDNITLSCNQSTDTQNGGKWHLLIFPTWLNQQPVNEKY